MPIMIPKLMIKSAFFDKSNNVFQNNDVPLTGRKRVAFTRDLDLVQIKKFCKQTGCTINEYATSLIGTAMYEYSEKQKDFPTPDKVQYSLAFSMRQPVKELS